MIDLFQESSSFHSKVKYEFSVQICCCSRAAVGCCSRQAKVAAIETATIVQVEYGNNQALGDTTARSD